VLQRWLIAFAFTQVVEVPIYLWALRDRVPSPSKRFAYAFGASLVTHPVVWFAFPRLITTTYRGMVVAAEVFAIVVEAMILSGAGLPRPFLWALVANLTSVSLGLLSRYLFGLP
jgi:hypothetical protein